jgi:hypothetical protein
MVKMLLVEEGLLYYLMSHYDKQLTPTVSNSPPTVACSLKAYKYAQLLQTLKIATAVFAETLDNFQNSTRLLPDSRRCTVNSSRENLRSRIME